MATAFTATQGAVSAPAPKPVGAGVSFVCWGTYNAATALVINDTIAICKIPANTYVYDGYLLGTDIDTGTAALKLDVGIAANGVDSADAQAFLVSPVLSGSAVTDVIGAAGIRMPFQGTIQTNGPRLFTVETTVMVKVTAAANGGGTGRITVYVHCFNA